MHRLASFVPVLCAAAAPAQEFPGRTSQWHGFTRHDFDLGQRRCILVVPERAAPGRPWIWRARFFGHQPAADRALLARGYHLAYCDVAGLFGAPAAVEHWNRFYRFATGERKLAAKVALEGMSRGGLIVYRWAAANPDEVACLYGDAPVCDFKSWPGGRGRGRGGAADWQRCLAAYGLDEAGALAYTGNPIDRLEPLAKAGIPLLHVVGAADEVVPVAENTAIVAARYRALGGTIHVIDKPGVGHHPHALPDPWPIVAFVTGSCRRAGSDRGAAPGFDDNLQVRGGLANAARRFRDGTGHVAFLGGSITEMDGFRPLVAEALQRRFPKTRFRFTNAGIASTCSTTGAFRLATDVLAAGPVDLLVVEFAVNDDQDAAHDRDAAVRGMEGILRRLRRHEPRADAVIVHFVNPSILATRQRAETPRAIAAHEAVAAHYAVPSVDLAREVAGRILQGVLTWKQFGGTHPKRPGNELAAAMLDRLFERCLDPSAAGERVPHPLPAPLSAASYGGGGFLPPARAEAGRGFAVHRPDWQSLPGSKRQRFTSIDMLCATEPGAELTLRFAGDAIGAYVCAGPDAGILEGSLDGRALPPVDLFHRHSRGLHYPRTVMFATGLTPGDHLLVLRVARDTRSRGHAVRIMQFCVNAN